MTPYGGGGDGGGNGGGYYGGDEDQYNSGGRYAGEKDMSSLRQELIMDEHRVPITELYARYSTDEAGGLSTEQAGVYLNRDGPNELTPPPEIPEGLKFMKHLFGGFQIILWVGGMVCLTAFILQLTNYDHPPLDNLYMFLVLSAVATVTGVFSYFQDWRASRIMNSFRGYIPQFTDVIRDGRRQQINVRELVVGDLVEVKAGDKIPADIRIISAGNLRVDTSSLTGDPDPQIRSPENTNDNPLETRNLIFMCTYCVEGTSKGIVIRTGDRTVFGRIANLASSVDNSSTSIAKEIRYFIIIVTVFSFFLGCIWFLIAFLLQYFWWDAFMYLIGLMVAHIPQGLLTTLTVSLSLTGKRMARRNCLVKNLQAVESLGSVSCIVTNKSGVLTQNNLTVQHLWFDLKEHEVELNEQETADYASTPTYLGLLRAACLCNNAEFKPHQANVPAMRREVVGRGAEAAVLRYTEHVLGDSVGERDRYPKVAEIPFSSSNKFQLSIHELPAEGSRYLLVVKGAPEKILDLCQTMLLSDDRNQPQTLTMTDRDRKAIHDACKEFGSRDLEQIIAFADLDLPPHKFPPGYRFKTPNSEGNNAANFPEGGYRFLGLVSMVDPPRATVPDAVRKCRDSGIRVIMITGDHPATAKAVARKVGILSENSETVEEIAERRGIPVQNVNSEEARACIIQGHELRELGQLLDEYLMRHDEIIFARTNPSQKIHVTSALQRLGYVVAITGDGVNDAMALSKADIGISMGIDGCDISKQMADVVLLDDSFSSIVAGIEEGRLIYDNLKKTVAYSITSNIPEIVPFIIWIVADMPIFISTLTILCIDLGTDLLPSVSFVYEKAEVDLMKRRPRNQKTDKLINERTLAFSFCQMGFMQTIGAFFAAFVVMTEFGFWPTRLVGLRREWDSPGINDVEDSYGQEWVCFLFCIFFVNST